MLGLFSVRIFFIIWVNFCCCGIHLTLSVHECRVSDSVRQKRNLLHQVSKIIGLGMIGSSIVSSRVRLPPSCQILYKKYFLKLKAKNGTSQSIEIPSLKQVLNQSLCTVHIMYCSTQCTVDNERYSQSISQIENRHIATAASWTM